MIAVRPVFLMIAALGLDPRPQATTAPDGWQPAAPRDEIRPRFEFDAKGGRGGKGRLAIVQDARAGLQGYWTKTFAIEGGRHYRFEGWRKAHGVTTPRTSVRVRIHWGDEAGKPVLHDTPWEGKYLQGRYRQADPEHPTDRETDDSGWTRVSDTYQAPSKARRARVELHLLWAPKGTVEWSEVTFAECPRPAPRKARLGAVHYSPKGKTPEENRNQYAPLIEEAARQKADLVVLGEVLTYPGTGLKYPDEVAEPVPGPSTEFFGRLSKKHGLYVVAGLVERDGPLLYNVAVLTGPDGRIVGKYRKVCLPEGEGEDGIAPGDSYPVFETRFGKVGMMICYDGFFPEVARRLASNGAEVIAWPVWGCSPLLARARAYENRVYVVSSTYCGVSSNWMLSAVFGHDGEPLTAAEKMGSVVVAEVDLDERFRWQPMGDFRSQIHRHRPAWGPEDK